MTKRPVAFFLGILVVVIGLGVSGYFFWKARFAAPGAGLSAEEFARLDALRRSANRDLENQAQLDLAGSGELGPREVAAAQVKKLAEMATPYAELTKALPGELIGPRNEAVLWLLAQMPNGVSRQGLTEEDAKFLDEQASAALDRLLQRKEGKAENHMLAALFALRRMERFRANREAVKTLREEAIRQLREVLAADPGHLEAAYQLGVLLDGDRNSPPSDEAAEAFAKAYAARPGNFYVLMRHLNVLVRRKSPETAAACRAAKPVCECVRRRILRENDPESDLIVLLDRAANAAETGKWDEAEETLQIFDSWLTAIASDLGDLPEVTPHPLDAMIFDFSRELRKQFAAAAAPPAKAIEVSFAASTLEELQLEQTAIAVRLLDFDLDGKLELAVLAPEELKIYRRSEEGRWTPVSTIATSGAKGFCWGDLDRDENPQIEGDYRADLDLVIYGESGLAVYANHQESAGGERRFQSIATLAGDRIDAAVLVDFDHDGDLDLVASGAKGVSLFINLGNGQFEEASAYSSLPPVAPDAVGAMIAVDFDRDGDLDVMMTCLGREKAGYLDNTRHGQMRWRELPPGFEDLTKAERIFVADLDGNASWDLVIQAANSVVALLTEQTSEGEIRVKSRTPIGEEGNRVVAIADFDNDRSLDALLVSASGGVILRGDGAGGFRKEDAISVFADGVKGAFDIDDLDGDGDLDVVFADQSCRVAINEGGNQNHWISVRPRGAEDNVSGKVNHYGLGTLVEVQTGASYQAAVTDRPSTHFGLGNAASADQIRLVFTNGFPQSVRQARLQSNQVIVEEMALKGSCPYVYTDRGAGWEFFSDCLWGAPIGMQYAEAKLQPGRAWEYLKLPGEMLAARDGAYRILFTEELWEATYVDHVALIAVDHPEGVEIFTNEKVGPPSVAEHRIFTVSKRLAPRSAKDLKGRDLSQELAKADGVYTQGWDRAFRQGLVERHGLELDLGDFDQDAKVVLYLTGWIMPTDTSLNVGISQNPQLTGPRPPSLSVYDESGELKRVSEMIGFPGGKTKTIAIDLTGKFASSAHRVVIETTQQIYWDEAFFTVNEPEAELTLTTLPVASAKMFYWGFSQKAPQKPRSPSVFDASSVDRAPRWLPMGGGFTEYGDVLPLLEKTDDQMAVIGAGDAIEMTFSALPPPPEGWKRDFILHSVGWDKDADLNTFFGQTAGPMPVGPDGGYLGPAILDRPQAEGTRIQPRARFWKQLLHEAQQRAGGGA